jgi:hypothetical protein
VAKKTKVRFEGEWKRLIDAVAKNVIPSGLKDQLEDIGSEEDKEGARVVLEHMRRCMKAFFELHTVCDDMVLTLGMAKRYPWGNRTISRGQHLGFVWFQFINLCYLFKEKYKLSGNEFNKVMRLFQRIEREDVKVGVREIDEKLGKYIQTRGRHLHEWYENDEAIKGVWVTEFIKKHGGQELRLSEKGAYGLAHLFLVKDVKDAQVFMEKFIGARLKGYMFEFAKVAEWFNDVIDALKTGRASVRIARKSPAQGGANGGLPGSLG